MPNPISGNAVALAATQLRIINLDQVLDANISTSMNFAIDFTNQTFRMTGLQFTDYLNQSLAISAGNIGFDNAIFQSVFPLEPTPPDNTQDVIDYGLPILANADAGNIGKEVGVQTEVNAYLLTENGFHFISDGVNVPVGDTRTVLIHTNAATGAWLQILADTLTGKLSYRVKNNSDVRSDREIFSSSIRTSAQANTTLDNADIGNIGKTNITLMLSDDIRNAGFYTVDNSDAGLPIAENGTLIHNSWTSGSSAGTQIYIPFQGGAMYVRSLVGGAWTTWTTLVTSTDLAAYLPIDGSQPMTGKLSFTYDTNGGFPAIEINNTASDTTTGVIEAFYSPTAIGMAMHCDTLGFTFRESGQGSVFTSLKRDGSIDATSDITAFLGVAVVAQPFIAATGATTAYDLIELLLDKVDELETRLANAGIA